MITKYNRFTKALLHAITEIVDAPLFVQFRNVCLILCPGFQSPLEDTLIARVILLRLGFNQEWFATDN